MKTSGRHRRSSRSREFGISTFFDLAPVAYVTIDRRGMVVEANLAAATLLGIARLSMKDRSFSAFVSAEDADRFHLYRQTLFSSGTKQTCELSLRRPDGRVFPARFEALAASDETGERLQVRAAIVDLTETRQTQAALEARASELRRTTSRLQNLVGSMMDSLIVLAPSGIIESVNTATLSLLGYEAHELIGQRFGTILGEGEGEGVVAAPIDPQVA